MKWGQDWRIMTLEPWLCFSCLTRSSKNNSSYFRKKLCFPIPRTWHTPPIKKSIILLSVSMFLKDTLSNYMSWNYFMAFLFDQSCMVFIFFLVNQIHQLHKSILFLLLKPHNVNLFYFYKIRRLDILLLPKIICICIEHNQNFITLETENELTPLRIIYASFWKRKLDFVTIHRTLVEHKIFNHMSQIWK